MAENAEPNFEGHEGRECGEHRTTGGRAWCFSCSEWCYLTLPCKGCELPLLRDVLASVWLYIDWRHVTQQLTTRQRDAFANVIDEHSGSPSADRWWRN